MNSSEQSVSWVVLKFGAKEDINQRALLKKLSPEKRALVLKKLRARQQQERGQDPSATPPIVPVSREKPVPLSFAQQRLWFLDQLEEGRSAAYNVPRLLRLTGHLNVNALEQAIATLVQRHESLRTTFAVNAASPDKTPVQVIAPALTVNLVQVDLQSFSPETREAEARRRADEELLRPFNLATGPLFRVTCYKLAEDTHILQLILHHIICDGWSLSVLTRELSTLYSAFHQKRPSPLSPLTIQYADFAAWQREHLTGARLEEHLAYWRNQLAGAPPLLELPTDHPRPSMQSVRGRSLQFTLDEALTPALKQLGQRSGATLFMTLHAAFALFLSKYGNTKDVIIGTPVASRNRRELEGLIGFFVNTLALRTSLEGDPSFVALLDRVCRTVLDGQAHQDVPFEKLVEELQVTRSLSHNPLFQVMFALQNVPAEELALRDLNLVAEPWESSTTMFDLSLTSRRRAQA